MPTQSVRLHQVAIGFSLQRFACATIMADEEDPTQYPRSWPLESVTFLSLECIKYDHVIAELIFRVGKIRFLTKEYKELSFEVKGILHFIYME